jgi:hypothetical protein
VRPEKRSALIKHSLLLEVTSHTAMGIAVGLAFAFLATHIAGLCIATVINYGPTPDTVMLMFVGTLLAPHPTAVAPRARALAISPPLRTPKSNSTGMPTAASDFRNGSRSATRKICQQIGTKPGVCIRDKSKFRARTS